VATFGDLTEYLERAPGWQQVPNLARGKRRTGDHTRYAKALADGSQARTRVSGHPREEIGEDLFRRILREQLRVSEQEFWSVVLGQAPGTRPPSALGGIPAPPAPGVPGWLVNRLISVAGIPEDEVLDMTPEEAQAAWDSYQSEPR
jgi:hypothetical protein